MNATTTPTAIRIKLDLSGSKGDEAWRLLKHDDEMLEAHYGPAFGSGCNCRHAPDAPHAKGEWMGARIVLPTPLLAQYAIRHYLNQPRVLDAEVEE